MDESQSLVSFNFNKHRHSTKKKPSRRRQRTPEEQADFCAKHEQNKRKLHEFLSTDKQGIQKTNVLGIEIPVSRYLDPVVQSFYEGAAKRVMDVEFDPFVLWKAFIKPYAERGDLRKKRPKVGRKPKPLTIALKNLVESDPKISLPALYLKTFDVSFPNKQKTDKLRKKHAQKVRDAMRRIGPQKLPGKKMKNSISHNE